jgi:tetratricopeptide (TPR) repeat protein
MRLYSQTITSKVFKSQLEEECLQAEGVSREKLFANTYFKTNYNSNPLQLYQEAIKNYHANKFHDSINLLLIALTGFADKKDERSQECFKCHSTLISCYRELKQFDNAIQSAENVIKNFDGKFNLVPIIKKYHECLKLRGDKPKIIYNSAIANYKGKEFHLAIEKLIYAIDTYDQNSKDEIASCHSTLASCYRDIGSLPKAQEHCEQALKLRNHSLKENDPLIQKTETKLKEILDLISTQEENSNSFSK